MTFSLIITNRENPSELMRPKRSAIVLQKSFDLVLESTSKACGGEEHHEIRTLIIRTPRD